MFGSIRGRKRDRDNKVGRDKPKKNKDEKLPPPGGDQVRQHRNRAFPVGRLLRDTFVDRKRSKKRKKNQNQRGDRRKRTRRERGDSRLVTQSRKIIDPGQTHDLPPAMAVVGLLRFTRPFDFGQIALQEPLLEGARATLIRPFFNGSHLGHSDILKFGPRQAHSLHPTRLDSFTYQRRSAVITSDDSVRSGSFPLHHPTETGWRLLCPAGNGRPEKARSVSPVIMTTRAHAVKTAKRNRAAEGAGPGGPQPALIAPNAIN